MDGAAGRAGRLGLESMCEAGVPGRMAEEGGGVELASRRELQSRAI